MNRALIGGFLLVLLWAAPAAGGSVPAVEADADRYTVYVVTMGPGPELFARFGHIGLVVKDGQTDTMNVYNFGTFDFLDPSLRGKYALGDLRYWLSIESFPPMVRYYRAVDREVTLRTLNLSPKKAQWLAEKLNWLSLPSNREYLYRHYTDNCCTRIRDLLDVVSDRAISKAHKGELTGRTFRTWTSWSLEGQWVTATVIDFCLGPAVDKPLDRWQEEFLPGLLTEDLDAAVLDSGQPFVLRRDTYSQREGPHPTTMGEPFDLPVTLGLVALLGFGVLVPLGLGQQRPRLARRALGVGLGTWGVIGGLGGTVLLLFWTITTHYDTHGNENLLPFLPTHLLLLWPSAVLLRRAELSPRLALWLRRYLVASLAIIALALFLKLRDDPQDNYRFLWFAAGLDGLLLLGLRRVGLAARWFRA